MGLFDCVYAACPKCGTRHEVQSKTGECKLKRYAHEAVPVDVARGVNGDTFRCCSMDWRLEVPPTPRVAIRIKPADEQADEAQVPTWFD